MIARDELKRLFKLLRKHEDLLVSAYLDNGSLVDETDLPVNAVDALVNASLLRRPSDNESIRLSRELSGLFERALRDPRRLTVDADIGGFVSSIEHNIGRYKDAVRHRATEDVNHYLDQIERLIDDLRSSLLDSSGHLWQKINSEFGYVTSLDLKIKENEAVLEQATRLNDSLEIIKVSEMDEMAGNDPALRRYLLRWLLDTVELCRKEIVDAMHKLNELLFEYRKKQRLGRLIDAFYHRYQTKPGYTPLDYTDTGDIPEILNQAAPMPLTGHADISDPQQEVALTETIAGLRKERVAIEEADTQAAIDVLPEEPPVGIPLSPLRQAVEAFYIQALEADRPLSAIAHRPTDEIESDAELWLYAVIARHNNMDEGERVLFDITFQESLDPVFSGRLLVHDVRIGFRAEDNTGLSASG